MKIFISALGWILLFISLASGYLYNQFHDEKDRFAFTPISWNNHIQVFDGTLSCLLLPEEKQARIEYLHEEIFEKVIRKKSLSDGYVFFFDDNEVVMNDLTEFIKIEKLCCPFFKFDLSVLPFGQGIALKISGSELVKEFIEGNFSL